LFFSPLQGISSVTLVALAFFISRRITLPSRIRKLSHATVAIATIQVTLGILTLLNHVPVNLGILHQSGSLTLLTFMIMLLHSLRTPPISL
jgi:cytochrome c oxidase assembly protein subunit 15